MDVQAAAGVAMFATVTAVAVMTPRQLRAVGRAVARVASWVGVGERARVAPAGRPIELIAADVHRLGLKFQNVPAGVSFARFEARRQAYDGVLVEACRALDVDHLLRVLPPGTELDGERERVQLALDRAGFRLDETA